ncbi:30S ribosomal protein S16 [Chlamydiota bacterium]
MALKIRLRQQGRKNQQTYRLVLSDSRAPRDGKYIENLGWYNPAEAEPEKNLSIHADRVEHWLSLGAILSERAALLVKRSAPQVLAAYREKLAQARLKANQKRKAKKKELTAA